MTDSGNCLRGMKRKNENYMGLVKLANSLIIE